MLINGRRLLRITALIITAVFSAVIFCACKTVDTENNQDEIELPVIDASIFSVHYLNVGQGDSIFINFPDGKIMLIDLGPKDQDVSNYIKSVINQTGKDKIDYLILTHPEEDHVGNAEEVIKDFSIGTAYLPYVKDKSKFPSFEKAYDVIREKADKMETSEMGRCIVGENYFGCFIWPKAAILGGYDDINLGESTSAKVNGTSAVLYLEYLNTTFLFTGDANKTAMDGILEYYKVGLLNHNVERKEVKLREIDFFKVAHHGSSDSLNREFLWLVNPKNSIISVGAGNDYNHPSTTILTELENSNIYRTDINGTISVTVDKNGKSNISKQI